MNTSRSLRALRRENPRSQPRFAATVDSYSQLARAHIAASAPTGVAGDRRRRPRLISISFAAAGAAVVAAVASLTVGPLGSGPGVGSATAAVKRAAGATAASADRSGTAVVRITRGGEVWAASTVRWNGNDMSFVGGASAFAQRPGKVGAEFLVVDGLMYGPDPEIEGGWIEFGSPDSIDPDSGTTPAEYLAAVRDDVGGSTLRRITGGMTGLTTRSLEDGSTVYSGKVAAGLIARETGFKDGEAIRVFPFGYVAHDEAANPAALLDIVVAVGPDRVVRSILVTWGSGASAWSYTVTYSDLGATSPPTAPASARSLRLERVLPKPAQR